MRPGSASPSASWLPPGKTAAVCFSIDDVHPARSSDHYEAGGDLGGGALRHLQWLLERHPRLRTTLFVTPDWREISPVPTRRTLAKIPYLRDRLYLAPILPKGRMRLDRHPEFVRFLSRLPRTEIAPHGLHHVHRGPRVPIEFQEQTTAECRRMLLESLAIFEAAGLDFVRGMTPPGFNAPPRLLEAMAELGFTFVGSARDIVSPVSREATTAMTGLRGQPLIYPSLVQDGKLVHVPVNFQATSPAERAWEALDNNGLLSIKAHVVKNAMGHIALDGLDESYRSYLDTLFEQMERRYGDALWWTTMGEIARRMLAAPPSTS